MMIEEPGLDTGTDDASRTELSRGLTAEPLVGKTYSLRPNLLSSDGYYHEISRLADSLLQGDSDIPQLLDRIRRLGKNRRSLGILGRQGADPYDGHLIELLRQNLSSYTPGVRSHLRELRLVARWDRSLAMREGQYHLAMLEIELVNRLCAARFRTSGGKLAFLPHCLRDLSADCRAAQRDVDYVCKGCTDGCNVNRTSKMLRLHGVKPYIWMTADLRAVFRKMKKEGKSVAVLGIACIPELLRGMRMCLKHDVPVVGVPLDANRCARWWGEFRWNTVNFRQLESLLTG